VKPPPKAACRTQLEHAIGEWVVLSLNADRDREIMRRRLRTRRLKKSSDVLLPSSKINNNGGCPYGDSRLYSNKYSNNGKFL
jgi:hypothetical protein